MQKYSRKNWDMFYNLELRKIYQNLLLKRDRSFFIALLEKKLSIKEI